jgi:acyl dehydratase
MALLTKTTEVGHEFAGNVKKPTSWRSWLYSGGWPHGQGWPAKNIHTDLEFAQSCGVPVRITSGGMPVGYIAELMIDLFGEGWFRAGKMSTKFIKGTKVNDFITPKAVVKSKEPADSGTRFVLDFWCENQDGEKLVVGSATCVLK